MMNRTEIKNQLCRTLSAFAVVATLFASPNANADTRPTAHGNWTDCENVVSDVQYPGYEVITLSITSTYTGTFEGIWEGTEQDVIYPDGFFTVHAEGTFTGSVAGMSGTVRLTYYAAVPLTPSPPPDSPWYVDQGTDNLAGLRGKGTWVNFRHNGPPPGCDDSFSARYLGQISFAP